MLRFLAIRDFIIVKELEIAFAPAFTVVTGETGAGKSILMDALNFAFGDRSPQSPGAHVTLEIEVDTTIQTLLDEQGLKDHEEPDRLVVRRLLTPEGRSRCFVNGTSVPQSMLKELGTYLVSFHHQDDRIVDARHQRRLLDDYGQLTDLKGRVEAAFGQWQDAAHQEQALRTSLIQASQDQAFWQESLAELVQFGPLTDEETQLLEERSRWRDKEGALTLCQRVQSSLESGGALEERMRQVIRDLEKVDDSAELLADWEKALETCYQTSRWVERRRISLQEGITHHPDEIEARLFELRRLARKHGLAPGELAAFQKTLAERIESVASGETHLDQLVSRTVKAKQVYEEKARSLSLKRRETAVMLEQAIHQRLPDLKLPHARFRVGFQKKPESQWNADGMEIIEFYVQTNPGSPEGSLKEVASGGEKARLLLALKAATAHVQMCKTLVFDEIDQGVGGSVAEAMGMALRELAQGGHQVLAITHAPQVAAVGDVHWIIEKHQEEDHTTVQLRPLLSWESRIEELARMLSGHAITPASRHVAHQLLEVHHGEKS